MRAAQFRASCPSRQQAGQDRQHRADSPLCLCPGRTGFARQRLLAREVVNAGRSAARQLALNYDGWPTEPDDLATSIRRLFQIERTLPPGYSIRAVWRPEGPFTDGTIEAGLGVARKITASYRFQRSVNGMSGPPWSSLNVQIDRRQLCS